MSRQELLELKENELIKFIGKHDLLTCGKMYEVIVTNVGRMIKSDTNIGLFLWDNDLYKMFKADSTNIKELK